MTLTEALLCILNKPDHVLHMARLPDGRACVKLSWARGWSYVQAADADAYMAQRMACLLYARQGVPRLPGDPSLREEAAEWAASEVSL